MENNINVISNDGAVAAENQAEAITDENNTAENFFTWDEEYARQRKTRYSRLYRILVMVGFVVAGVLVLLIDSFVLPDSMRSDNMLWLGLALIFPAAIFIPQFTFKKLFAAAFTSFVEHDGTLWQVALTPRTANTKYGQARQQFYINETYAAAHSKDAVIEIIENAKSRKLKSAVCYKKPKVKALDNIAIEKRSRKVKCSYTTSNGAKKNIIIFDCYPGLIEYISNK